MTAYACVFFRLYLLIRNIAMQARVIPAILDGVTGSCRASIPKIAAIVVESPINGATTDAGPTDRALNERMKPKPINIPAIQA